MQMRSRPVAKIQKLKVSIEDFNHSQFIEILGKLLSRAYMPAFNINAPIDEAGTTFLSVAISYGNTKAIHELRKAGADKTGMDTVKLNAALIAAIRNGENQLMNQLLELGAEPHHRIEETGISTLHVAAMCGNVDAIKKLLSLNISSLNCDAHGDTPLSISVKRNDVEAVRVFIDSILDKNHPADRLLKHLKYNRQLEYLLNSAQSAEVMTEICRLISYLDLHGIPHAKIANLVKSPFDATKVMPYMVGRETENYYASLKANNLTRYHDFLQIYYQFSKVNSPLSRAIVSNNLMTVKMLLIVTPLYLADFDKFKNKHQLLVQLDKDYPEIVNSLLDRELQRLDRYIKDNDIASVNSICDLAMINPDARKPKLFKHMKAQHQFRDAILAAKDSKMCLALLRMIDILEQNGQIDHHDLLPEKYTFANYHLKEDIFEAIKKLPPEERIKKYNAILNDEKSVYYRIFHMKRGYIWSVNEKRGILHDVREAYDADKKAAEDNRKAQDNQKDLNDRLYRATLKNNLAKMRRCIKQGADVNYKNTIELISYPIHVASFYGFTDAVSLLIENGVNVNMVAQDGDKRNYGVSALGYAACAGNADVVDLLLSKGANTEIARRSDNYTPLMMAIDKANLKIVKSLLNHQAKIDTFGNASIDFKSPLVIATRAGSEEILDTLVNHMINNYDIERIVTFLLAHDDLKTCYNRAGTNSQLLEPLQKLAKYLVIHHVGSEILDSIPPEHIATPEKKVDAIPETTTASLYPKINQEPAPQSDALQQYLDAAKQKQFVSLPPVLLNPFTDKPLPISAVSPVTTGSLMAIDAILMAPKAPKHASWLTELNEIDFSQTEPSSTAVIINQLGDLMSFEEPAKADVNTFDGLVEQEKQPVAAKPGDINQFDEKTEDQHDTHVAAQLDALPKAPSQLVKRSNDTKKSTRTPAFGN